MTVEELIYMLKTTCHPEDASTTNVVVFHEPTEIKFTPSMLRHENGELVLE